MLILNRSERKNINGTFYLYINIHWLQKCGFSSIESVSYIVFVLGYVCMCVCLLILDLGELFHTVFQPKKISNGTHNFMLVQAYFDCFITVKSSLFA